MRPVTRRLAMTCLAGAGAALAWRQADRYLTHRRMQEHYAEPLPAPRAPQRVFHLGHSLVGHDMPAMLAQLAGPGHVYESQTGWGTSLKQHWEGGESIQGVAEANDHPRYRNAHEAIGSGEYDTVVLTEMVEIRDAIRYHDSADYLSRWATLARSANPATRVYLYETWHHTDDAKGWLNRIDSDLRRHWQQQVIYPAIETTQAPIHLIPAGQVMAAYIRAVEASGGIDGTATVHDLFARHHNGTQDTIHFNDLGAYLVSLVHYAVVYHGDPVGMPHALLRADGTAAKAPSAEAADLMQRTVRDTVARFLETGVTA